MSPKRSFLLALSFVIFVFYHPAPAQDKGEPPGHVYAGDRDFELKNLVELRKLTHVILQVTDPHREEFDLAIKYLLPLRKFLPWEFEGAESRDPMKDRDRNLSPQGVYEVTTLLLEHYALISDASDYTQEHMPERTTKPLDEALNYVWVSLEHGIRSFTKLRRRGELVDALYARKTDALGRAFERAVVSRVAVLMKFDEKTKTEAEALVDRSPGDQIDFVRDLFQKDKVLRGYFRLVDEADPLLGGAWRLSLISLIGGQRFDRSVVDARHQLHRRFNEMKKARFTFQTAMACEDLIGLPPQARR